MKRELIEHHVAGTGIESEHILRSAASLEHGDVGDAADVHHRARMRGLERGSMECGHQRRALAAGATSRARKSATTSIPVSSASVAGAFNCSV